MEMIDVLTPEGKPTGISKTKEDIHLAGDWHRAVHVWVVRPNGELLIQKRAADKDNHPNKWDISAAGHVSAGEGAVLSAQREVEEEIGLPLTEDQLEYIGTLTLDSALNGGTYLNREYNDVYLVQFDGELTDLNRQVEEVQELRFIHWTELRQWVAEKRTDLVWHFEEYELLFEVLVEKGF